jgi:hypothetical protein
MSASRRQLSVNTLGGGARSRLSKWWPIVAAIGLVLVVLFVSRDLSPPLEKGIVSLGQHNDLGGDRSGATTHAVGARSVRKDESLILDAKVDVATIYASEEFMHVPDWIPRPMHAVSASAENATLRSDGLREGIVRFTFASRSDEAATWLGQALAQTGLHAGADGRTYKSDSPTRNCEVKTESMASKLTHVTLSYEAFEHSQGCACPTCHEEESPSE